LTINSN